MPSSRHAQLIKLSCKHRRGEEGKDARYRLILVKYIEALIQSNLPSVTPFIIIISLICQMSGLTWQTGRMQNVK